MRYDTDVLIIGAGPAGATSAILMAQNGWRVTVIERDTFPRQKVCGECVAAGNLVLLDSLGVGLEFRRAAGPELRQVGWMSATQSLSADMPACTEGNYAYGHAIGRDLLDALLLERARVLGATVLQPAAVEAIHGGPGRFECEYSISGMPRGAGRREWRTVTAAVVIDAHGSWDRGPRFTMEQSPQRAPRRHRADVFAFKATFRESQLAKGLLPVLAIEGGYGGLVVADNERTTVACCLRRDLLARCRAAAPGASAGTSIELFLRRACPDFSRLLHGAHRDGTWMAVGPVRPGMHMQNKGPIFRVGNAAGETHPLIGEGIGMALQSAVLLTNELARLPPGALGEEVHNAIQERYSTAWRHAFIHRLRLSQAYAYIAMHPFLARCVGATFRRWPHLLTYSARWAGKSRHAGAAASTINFCETP